MPHDVPRARRIPVAALAAAALAAAVLPAVVTPAAQAATPTTPAFTSAIEAPAGYDGQAICSPKAKPGTTKLAKLLVATYGPADIGISRPCSDGGQSEHKEGRALDWMLSYKNKTQRHKVQAFLAWLLAPDQYGNQAAMARRLGVMYMGWNNQMWRSYGTMGWGDLKGCTTNPAMKASSYDTTCHRNHLHISLSWDGAAALTSFWTGKPLAAPCEAPWSSSATVVGAGSDFVAVTPVRVLDTQRGSGIAAPCRLAAPETWNPSHHDLVLSVAGVGGMPATGVAAVMLRVTASRPSTPPETVYARTTESSTSIPVVTLTSGLSAASTVVVPVASDGTVRLWVDRGDVDLRADVLGYAPVAAPSPPTAPSTGTVHAFSTTLLYDGTGAPLAPGESRVVHLAGVGPVPADGLAALALTLTVSATTTSDLVAVVTPDRATAPGSVRTSTTRARAAQAFVPTSGDVVVSNGGASPVTVTLSTTGFVTTAPTAGGGTLHSLASAAVVADSARAVGINAITSSASQTFAVTPSAAPAGATGVLVSVSVRGGSSDGALALGAVGSRHWTAALSFGARGWAHETVLLPLGPTGRLGVATSSLGAQVRVRILGYVA